MISGESLATLMKKKMSDFTNYVAFHNVNFILYKREAIYWPNSVFKPWG